MRGKFRDVLNNRNLLLNVGPAREQLRLALLSHTAVWKMKKISHSEFLDDADQLTAGRISQDDALTSPARYFCLLKMASYPLSFASSLAVCSFTRSSSGTFPRYLKTTGNSVSRCIFRDGNHSYLLKNTSPASADAEGSKFEISIDAACSNLALASGSVGMSGVPCF
jgi:hypothetical protein